MNANKILSEQNILSESQKNAVINDLINAGYDLNQEVTLDEATVIAKEMKSSPEGKEADWEAVYGILVMAGGRSPSGGKTMGVGGLGGGAGDIIFAADESKTKDPPCSTDWWIYEGYEDCSENCKTQDDCYACCTAGFPDPRGPQERLYCQQHCEKEKWASFEIGYTI